MYTFFIFSCDFYSTLIFFPAQNLEFDLIPLQSQLSHFFPPKLRTIFVSPDARRWTNAF